MSRILRGNASDASTIHALKSEDGVHELNAGDMSLPAAAAAFTIADTVEAWLEAMQRQINALTGTTPLLPSQLGSLWRQQQPYPDETPVTYTPDLEGQSRNPLP
jgi:hypothetical protein